VSGAEFQISPADQKSQRNQRSLKPRLKLQRQAGCSSPSGNTAELSVSLTAGSGRSVRVKNSLFHLSKDRQPIFMAAICSVPFELGDKAEEFLIVIAPRIKS
jgi:hypothetical protein